MMLSQLTLLLLTAGLAASQTPPVYTPVPYQQAPAYYPGAPWVFPTTSKVCHVVAPADGSDAAPAIIAAFQNCRQNAKVIFDNTTYNINSVMQTVDLSNVEVEILGTLLWSTNVTYWVNNSLPEGYQNQSTAWIFGGDHVHFYGHGAGTLNGNGDVWYSQFGSNNPGRPHQITFRNLTNSVVEGIRFIRSQMWTMTLINSQNVLLQDIYVNNTKSSGGAPQNTDGADTIYSNNITFARWVVDNGDDSISTKANSANILIEDCTFYNGLGLALGSIGQYQGQYETIVNVTARRIFARDTNFAMYAKVWTGTPNGSPPNGGGGGTGLIRNVTMENVTVVNVGLHYLGHLFLTTQCYGGSECDTSTFQIRDVAMRHVRGTSNTTTVASIQCSTKTPCFGIELSDVSVTTGGKVDTSYLCSGVANTTGFTCTGRTAQT